MTALFTSTSAVSVTGLVVVDTATQWSPFGQAVILALIEIGGFGFMTSSTLLLLLIVRGRTRLRARLLVQESLGQPDLGDVTRVVRRVAIFSIAVQVIGAALLTARFAAGGEAAAAGSHPLWWGVFHAVSAFNNAGFDLTGGFRSLIGLNTDLVVLGTIGVLVTLGSLGYAIVADVAAKRRWQRLALETKVVLLTSLLLLFGGAFVFAAAEWSNPRTLGPLGAPERAANALFESISLRTAGYASVDHARLAEPSLFVTMLLMFIGGASGSTAGGIKVNTFAVLLVAIAAAVRGRGSAEAFGRRIPHIVVYRALSVGLLAIAAVFLTTLALTTLSTATFAQAAFEAISALGTVGLTTGITPSLAEPALLVLILAMYVGRLGPLTLVLALAARQRWVPYRPAVESMRIG
jgi:trk system potassium uptake protein